MVCAILPGALLYACRPGTSRVEPRPAASSACTVDTGDPPAALTVAVFDDVDPRHAPAPVNDAERLVFRQLYETLVDIDCEGRIVPALAESWSTAENGRVWRFRMRRDAQFRDGRRVTAASVVESWTSPGRAAATGVFHAVEAGESELRVELITPASTARLFARPELAVSAAGADPMWPAGSGAYRPDTSGPRTTRIVLAVPRSDSPPSIEFRMMPGIDPRRALDTRVDALVTGDIATLEYARALADYSITRLPWSRTYVLVSRTPRSGADDVTTPTRDALDDLARNAVGGAVRPAEAAGPDGCEPTPVGVGTRVDSRTILYPRGDAIARGIAERLVALAWPAARAPAWLRALLRADAAGARAPVAVGLDSRALTDSLRASRGLAFVIPLQRDVLSRCRVRLTDDVMSPLADAAYLTPLLDARDNIIHRARIGRIVIEADGAIRFGGVSR